MRLPLSKLPSIIVSQYGLANIAHQDWVYVRIVKGIPGLKQARRIVNEDRHHALFGFSPVCHTPSLWHQKTRPIISCLALNKFGVKYTDTANFTYLVQCRVRIM